MRPAVPLLPAPGRGQYDRRQPRSERLSEQRARLVTAAALSFVEDGEPTVATVVRRAGVARNTFYEYFDDLAHARRAVVERARQLLDQELVAAEQRTRTPVERWRALAHAWVEWALSAAPDARLCLREGERGLSPAGQAFEVSVARALTGQRSAGVAAAPVDPFRVAAVAAAAEVLVKPLLVPVSAGQPVSLVERERVERTLVDVAVRLLR